MRQAGKESIGPTMDYTKNQDFAARDDLKKKGVQFAPLEDLPAMKAKVEPILGEWTKKSPLIAEFVAAAQAYVLMTQSAPAMPAGAFFLFRVIALAAWARMQPNVTTAAPDGPRVLTWYRNAMRLRRRHVHGRDRRHHDCASVRPLRSQRVADLGRRAVPLYPGLAELPAHRHRLPSR